MDYELKTFLGLKIEIFICHIIKSSIFALVLKI